MSKRGGNPKKPPEEEEWKKKKKFDDDPIVKRYTGGSYQSFKATNESESHRRDDEDSHKKKRYGEEPLDKRPGTDYGAGRSDDFAKKDDEGFKKNKKHLSGIMDEVFGGKKDASQPFANVQYTDNTKHIQHGEHHKHRRRSSGHSGHSGRDHSGHSGHRKKDADGSGSSTKIGEMPGYEKRKRKFDQDELFKKKEPAPAAPAAQAKADDEKAQDKKKKREEKKAEHDDLKKKKEKAKKAAREKDDKKAERPEGAGAGASGTAVDHGLPAGAMSDYEKKKKKDFTSEYGSQGSGGTAGFPTDSPPDEEETFERKKKKDYDYDTLFHKQETSTTSDTRLRQAYQTQQTYRSVSTSGSRTSLDHDSVEVRSESSKSPTGSQLEMVKSKTEAKSKKGKEPKKSRSSAVAGKKRKSDDVFTRLKIDKSKAAERVNRYLAEKENYPANYYKRIHKYFDLKSEAKLEDGDYDKLGKLMEDELAAAKAIQASDDDEFLAHLNIRTDEFSKKKRIKHFEEKLKSKYNDKLSAAENESIIRAYFDLHNEKLSAGQGERLDRIMREELLAKKLAISGDPESREKRIAGHPEVADKQPKDLNMDDVATYYDLDRQSTTQIELNLLYSLLKGELIDAKVADNQKTLLAEKKIPTDEAAKLERFDRFKTDLLVNYEVGNVKYFVGKYFGIKPDEISDDDLRALANVIRNEVNREMAKESEAKQEELQRTLNLIDDEVKIVKELKDFDESPTLIRTDKNAVAERLKRFNEIILPDYKSGAKKLNYRDRIATYFRRNLNSCSPGEIEELGRLMDNELKQNGVKFVDPDDQYLQDKNVDLNESKRNERVDRHNKDAEKQNEDLKSLAAKKLMSDYYEFDPSNLNDDEMLQFSTMMVDEILNPKGDETTAGRLEPAKQVLMDKGIDLSPAQQEKRRLKFRNEIEPEIRSHVKKLDYSYLVARYFGFGDSRLSPDEIARLKRLMDREILYHDKDALGHKYKISFEPNAISERLKRFADSIEPDYRSNLKKLNYRDRIQLYFHLKPNQANNEDLEKLGKLMEDELLKGGVVQYPTDNDLFLADLKIGIGPADRKKRLLKLKNELERNPIDCNNPSYLLKIYFDLKDMRALNDDQLKRLARIMDEEQLSMKGDLIANQMKDSSSDEKLVAMLHQLQLRDPELLKKGVYKLVLYREDADGRRVVDEISFKIKDARYLNDEVRRLEKENAAKINEMKTLIEEKLKSDQEDKSLIENLKRDLDKEIKQQSLLKIDIQKSGIDDPDEQEKLLEKLAQQKRNLEEQRNARIKEESERLRRETEEKYKQQLENLDEEERQKELRELEELEKAKKEISQKRKKEHLERKKRLQEEAERANLENQKKLDEQAKEYDEELRKQLDEEKFKLDEEYQKIRKANKEMAEKLKKEFEAERAKIEVNLMAMEKKIKEIRSADEDDRKNKLMSKAKELEEQNTKKLKDEAMRLEAEAKEEIKHISAKLEEEMNSPDKKGHPNIEAEMNRKRAKMVDAVNETNRKKLDELAKKMEAEAMLTLDETAKKLDEEAKKRLDKQLEDSRKEHEQQLAKLKEALQKLMNSKK